MNTDFRAIPGVDRILSDMRLSRLEASYSRPLITSLVRQYLDELRVLIRQGQSCPTIDQIAESIINRLISVEAGTLHTVINATGVILHTNLGRAILSLEARLAMDMIASGYCNLEFNLEKGTRGSRHIHIESLLCRVTGAEDALVVNNNASALLLAITSLAKKKEVIISRGQLVEIGGGVRIPDVIRLSGARLVEVGTTNRTYKSDFDNAITPRTAALLRVHSSNFKLVGFTRSILLRELVEIGHKHKVWVLDDLGSGCLLDTIKFGLDPEPMVQDSISEGADLVLFSGDKLLGGPQAGIIVGSRNIIEKLKGHPMARAVRIDKISLAGLAATLLHYIKGEALIRIPVWQMICCPLDELENRARQWVSSVRGRIDIIDGESMIGGGSLPGSTLPTRLVAIRDKGKNSQALLSIAQKLRQQRPAVIARIEKDTLLLDPRTVLREQDTLVTRALTEALGMPQ